MGKKQKPKAPSSTIALNRRARHEYHIQEKFEAGLVLEGWEVKSLRSGKGQLTDSYVLIRNGEAWLLGSHITPLTSASTHVNPVPDRTRKLLLHARELDQITTAIQAKGKTCVALALYWKGPNVKCEIALVEGKQLHDKRADDKDRDWERQKARLMRQKG